MTKCSEREEDRVEALSYLIVSTAGLKMCRMTSISALALKAQ